MLGQAQHECPWKVFSVSKSCIELRRHTARAIANHSHPVHSAAKPIIHQFGMFGDFCCASASPVFPLAGEISTALSTRLSLTGWWVFATSALGKRSKSLVLGGSRASARIERALISLMAAFAVQRITKRILLQKAEARNTISINFLNPSPSGPSGFKLLTSTASHPNRLRTVGAWDTLLGVLLNGRHLGELDFLGRSRLHIKSLVFMGFHSFHTSFQFIL